MYKQQGGLPTEETRKYDRHDLNEFTVEDECVPSPAHMLAGLSTQSNYAKDGSKD